MDLPIFCLVDARPVKVISGPDESVEVWGWDKELARFVQSDELLERVLMQDDWVEELTEEEFAAHLAKLTGESLQQVG